MTKDSSRKRGRTSFSLVPPTPSHRWLRKFKASTMQPSTSKTSTNNVYDILDSDENISEGESMVTITSNKSKRAKLSHNTAKKNSAAVPNASSHKPPPLNIVGVEYARINELLNKVRTKVDDYSISLAPFGIRVYAANTDRYNVLKNELKAAEIKFFTYQLRDEQMTKIVLHGLFRMTEDELKFHLDEAGVKPVKIKTMNIHQQRYTDHALYLLYFLKSENIKISNLRQIPAICHVKVRWQYYQNRRNGPMQCSRCMQYGHGGQNCFLTPVCIRCAGPHLSNQCGLLTDPATKQARTRIPNDMLRCGLCDQNHSANFSGCVKRQEFLDRQRRYRTRTQPQAQRPVSNAFTHAPELDNFNFPSLVPQNRASQFQPASTPQIAPGGDNLFTPNELMQIFSELMASMSQCRNKMEQISALGQIVIKYCHFQR